MNDVSHLPLAAQSALGTRRHEASRVVLAREGLRIAEEPFLHLHSLRLGRRAEVEGSRRELSAALQLELPSEANRCAGDAQRACVRLEPRAWLLIASTPQVLPAGGSAWLLTDVSARSTVFRLSGTHAASVLAAGTGLTLAAGGCARTLFAEGTGVMIQCLAADDYRLFVDVSLGHVMADWLADAGSRAGAL